MLCGVGLLHSSIEMRESGPVVLLAGEADMESAGRLRELLVSQIWRGERRLTVDVSELHFLDPSVVKVLAVAAEMLRERGGELVLAHPQEPVARVLRMLGADQVITMAEAPPA